MRIVDIISNSLQNDVKLSLRNPAEIPFARSVHHHHDDVLHVYCFGFKKYWFGFKK